VEIAFDGKIQRITAGLEVVLSLGAMHTPKVLMLSGIGDQAELQRLGLPVVQHLPGVGQNFRIILVLVVSGVSTFGRSPQQWRRGNVLLEEQSRSRHSGFADLPGGTSALQRRDRR